MLSESMKAKTLQTHYVVGSVYLTSPATFLSEIEEKRKPSNSKQMQYSFTIARISIQILLQPSTQ